MKTASSIVKALFCEVIALTSPIVCIFYTKGWYATPDDARSPYGQYEPMMRRIYSKFGKRFGDWWWLGIRNRAYGIAYILKPQHFKDLDTYADCKVRQSQRGFIRRINVDGYSEYTLSFKLFHIIVGYRLRPIRDEYVRHWQFINLKGQTPPVHFRRLNMDARPILSIRAGGTDD